MTKCWVEIHKNYMNLFTMDQGTLLEYFSLHSIHHKVVNQKQTQKMVKLANAVIVREAALNK